MKCKANGENILVRVYGQNTELFIDREKEIKVCFVSFVAIAHTAIALFLTPQSVALCLLNSKWIL